MKELSITIKGVTPILLHSPAGMVRGGAIGKKVIPTPEAEAEAGLYRNSEGKVSFPTYNFCRALVRAASGVKVGKRSVVPYVGGCLTPAEEYAVFDNQEYAVDTRRAIVQRQGVLRARPRIDEWTLTFKLLADDDNLPAGFLGNKKSTGTLEGIVIEAGQRVGIGDFRPANGGMFGRFELVKVEY